MNYRSPLKLFVLTLSLITTTAWGAGSDTTSSFSYKVTYTNYSPYPLQMTAETTDTADENSLKSTTLQTGVSQTGSLTCTSNSGEGGILPSSTCKDLNLVFQYIPEGKPPAAVTACAIKLIEGSKFFVSSSPCNLVVPVEGGGSTTYPISIEGKAAYSIITTDNLINATVSIGSPE